VEARTHARQREVLRLLEPPARGRPSFTDPRQAPALPPTRLAEGGARPALVCVPPVAATPDAPVYARLAAHLAGRRQVWSLHAPGHRDGEALPATLDALLGAWADTLARHLGHAPFALLGHSSGGWAAHALAGTLGDRGTPPAAVVLLDSPDPRSPLQEPINEAIARMTDDPRTRELLTPALLTAAAAYARFLTGLVPRPLDIPTLFVRPARSAIPESWPLPHDRVETPGDHFTLLGTHARATAGAIDAWLSAAWPPGTRGSRGGGR
uniref:alpha/beta fold hydrolase n=1 Tax=Streptomyces sp. SBT349 TaxID=1580539 RepID=UPI00066B1541